MHTPAPFVSRGSRSSQMLRRASPFALTVGLLAFSLPGLALAKDDELTLKRVLLSTGGVGYFEYEAEVSGKEPLSFDVRRDQVDDVLKSVVVYDDKGAVGSISLPGEEPLTELFRELPFKHGDLASPVSLLAALRGSEVEIQGSRDIKGRIVTINSEEQILKTGEGSVTRHRLTLNTDDGLQSLILEETDNLHFTDEELQKQIDHALKGIAEHGQQERRELQVRIAGKGARKVRVGYVIETPLWKSTYRLTMDPAPKAENAALQGWAVLENLSGEDWEDVELTIVSGNPVTFRQALYQAYYVDRPEVPVEVLGRVLPGVDEGEISPMMEEDAVYDMAEAPAAVPLPRAMNAMPQMAKQSGRGFGNALAMTAPGAPTESRVNAAESSDAATQVVFTMPTPITVANGHSLMVPLIGQDIPASRISLYQPGTHALHPLASVELKNDSDIGLPPGVLTLYDDMERGVSYVGDARLNPLPAGEKRLVSYAVDQKIRIHRNDKQASEITKAVLANGLLTLSRSLSQETSYRIAGDAKAPRKVVIEHPKQSGWELKDVKPESETSTHYRFAVDVPAGETVTFTVVSTRPQQEQISLASQNLHRIRMLLSNTDMPADVRKSLEKLPERMAALEELQREISNLSTERSSLIGDQDRIRQNLKSVPDDSDIYRRYLSKLTDQEDRLEEMVEEEEKLQEKLVEARKDLVDFIQKL